MDRTGTPRCEKVRALAPKEEGRSLQRHPVVDLQFGVDQLLKAGNLLSDAHVHIAAGHVDRVLVSSSCKHERECALTMIA